MRWTCATLIVLVLGGWCRSQPGAADLEARRQADERLLRDHHLASDGAALLAFFRERTLTPERVKALSAKVAHLGADSYRLRSRATAELIQAGEQARSVLADVVHKGNANLEIVRRAEQCLKRLDSGRESELAAAAVRLLAGHKTRDAARVLLNYLPFAPGPAVIEEIREALPALAKVDGRPDPAVSQAVVDPHPLKRALAGDTLARCGFARLSRPLLQDSVVEVRFQVAAAMVHAGEKQAVGVLIRLLPVLPADQAWQVEDLLNLLAGDSGPGFVLEKGSGEKAGEVWETWWRTHQQAVDLARVSQKPQLLGYTLITQWMGPKGTNGCVYELRPGGKSILWKIAGLRYPLDAQVIGKDRVLIAEYLKRQVTERDFKGNILWKKEVLMPIACQRLANGQTFIASRRSLQIVDRQGEPVFTYESQNTSIAAARRQRDGQFVLVTNAGVLLRLDAKGRVVKTFQVGQVLSMGGNIDLLPGGRILVPQYRDNQVVEYDAEGKVLWKVAIPLPTSAVQLPNGHVLAVSLTRQRVVELNRQGKEVWSYSTDGRPWRARRR